MEVRARMLKDCLLEDSNSCSSNGFKLFPRRPPVDIYPVIPMRKQSKVLQAVIYAVKSLRTTTNAVKSAPTAILPRSLSLSRRLSSKKKAAKQTSITIRVKDIVRWRSSKDQLHEGRSPPSYFQQSPPHHHHQYTTTSSWCDYLDFTSEFLASSCSVKESGKNSLQCVGEDSCTAITDADTQVGPLLVPVPVPDSEEDLESDKEYNSPISVLEIQDEDEYEDGVSDSSYTRCLDNVERTKQKLMETIKRFENLANISPFGLEEWESTDEESHMEGGGEIEDISFEFEDESCINTINEEIEDEDADETEEKASELWNRVKEGHAIWIHEEHLIMDFFRDEITQRMNSFLEACGYYDFEDHLVDVAKGWLRGERRSKIEGGLVEKRRNVCVREIERRDWNKKRTREEIEEVAAQIEDGLFSHLMSEIF